MRATSSMKTKIMAFFLFVATVGCLIFGYLWMDMAISYSYMETTETFENHSVGLTVSLLENELLGVSEDELMSKLEVLINKSDEIILKKDIKNHKVWLENLSFQFEDGRLKKVSLGRHE